jgi:hypothetical protein
MDPVTIALALFAAYAVTRKPKPAAARTKRVPATRATVAKLSPLVAAPAPGGGILNTNVPRPGVYVIADERNTRPLHVYAERAGLKYVKLDDRGDALVWRAVVGDRKQFPKYSTSRYLPLDPLIGSQSGIKKLAAKFGDAMQGVGAFFAGKWAKAGDAIDRILNENSLAILSGKSAQVAARVVVWTTAEELTAAALAHPRNSKVRWHWAPSSTGTPRKVMDLANGERLYIPTPNE